jgi:CO/xanthine dehydrogenase FAD-binding subunit
VFDTDGRFAPAFDGAVTTVIDVDQVLVAIGQSADLSHVQSSLRTERGFIASDRQTGATSLDGVFAGGDVTGGPATVVQAMATGQQVAAAIEAYLAGAGPRAVPAQRSDVRLVINGKALPASRRVPSPPLPVSQRTLRGEDCATLTREALAPEPFRCANCGCVAVNASDLAPALIALDARIRTTQRTLAADDLFSAALSRTTVLAADELIEEIEIPAPPPGSTQSYLKFRIRNAIDFPIVGVAVNLTVEDHRVTAARVVLGAVAPLPLRAHAVEEFLRGRALDEETAAVASTLAVRGVQPLQGNAFKVPIVRTLVRRALLF